LRQIAELAQQPSQTPTPTPYPLPPFSFSVIVTPSIELQRAIKKGDLGEVIQSIADGADVNKPSPALPIVLAVWHDRGPIVDYLSKLRAPIDEDGNLGTVLVNRDSRDPTLVHGGSAIHAAASRNNSELIKVLLGFGFSEYDRDDEAHTPYEVIGKHASGVRRGKGSDAYRLTMRHFSEERHAAPSKQPKGGSMEYDYPPRVSGGSMVYSAREIRPQVSKD